MDNNQNTQDNYSYQTNEAPQNSGYNQYPAGQQDPVTFGQWMLTILLTMIPVVNLIMLIVWAVSSDTQPSKQNWARAQLVWVIIGIVLSIILSAALAVVFAGVVSMFQ